MQPIPAHNLLIRQAFPSARAQPGDLYSFRSIGSSDRALGSVGSGSSTAGSFYWGVELVNQTNHTITAVTISYAGEQWRNSAAAAQSVSFQYSFSAQDIKTGSFITIPQLEFVSPITGGTAGARDGNSAAARTPIGPVTLTNISWKPGQSLWLRWYDPDHPGYDHGLAIDDFSLSVFSSYENTYDPPATFYDGTQGLSNEELGAKLREKIVPPFIAYPNSISALQWLDQDPGNANNVILGYSAVSEPKSSAGVSWTKEYLWPKSRGIGESGDDAVDLFNLRASAIALTSARADTLFDWSNTGDPNYHSPAPNTTADSDSWQPPADERGDIARSLFYMDVRYDSTKSDTSDLVLEDSIVNSSDMAVLSTLLAWHLEDPVSEKELRRNDIASLLQGNRNPFIDRPDFAEAYFRDFIFSSDDADADGMTTKWELVHQLNPNSSADALVDSDADGFTNFEEHWMETNPKNPADPATFFVDANYTGTEDGTVARPFRRIQSAIDALPAGTQPRAIMVRPGTYPERVYLNAKYSGKSRVHIFSEAGAEATIIDGEGVDSSVVRFYSFKKATFSGFTVRNAYTASRGGGLRMEAAKGGTILITDNIISNNDATRGSKAVGGGIYLRTADGSIVANNFIFANKANRGGGVVFGGGGTKFWHNTVVNNEAGTGGGGGLSALRGITPDVRNNIIWGNTSAMAGTEQIHQLAGSYNVIQGGAPGVGNLNADPRFAGPGDYHIEADSPARNKAEKVPLVWDADGDFRPQGLKADMGADEYVAPPINPNPIDTDGDGLPDAWELEHFGHLNFAGSDDPDGDGLTNAQERLANTDPLNPDSDGDGVRDGADAYPGDPTRWLPDGDPNDTIPPVITLNKPRNAVLLP